MDTAFAPQVLDLEGVHNFRDFGGYAVAGGGRLKKGLLWRSGQHNGATDTDLGAIGALGLATVFDLRTSKERNAYPCRRPDGFDGHITYSRDPVRDASAPHLDAARQFGSGGAEGARATMRDTYTRIAFRPELMAMVGQMAGALIEGKGPSLVNCMAGKDRTGISVAAIQLAAGVHRDDITADYLLTNTAGNAEARIQAGMQTLMGLRDAITEDAARVIMGVEAAYLDTAFAAIDARYGSVDAWLRDGVGIDDALRERLKAAIVEF